MYILDSAHVVHVAKTGNDGNSGKAGQYPVSLAADAKLTIASAVSAAASGDTIVIWPGDYAEQLDCGSKALTIIGTSRFKSKIVPAAGSAILAASDCEFASLSATGLGTDAHGIDASAKSRVVVRDCELYGNYSGLYGNSGTDIRIERCGVKGQHDGLRLMLTARVLVRGCVIRADGTYGTGAACYGLMGAGLDAVFEHCVIRADRNDVSSLGIAAAVLNTSDRAAFANCVFEAVAGSGHTGAAYGFAAIGGAASSAMLTNCVARVTSANAGTGPYDLYRTSGQLVIAGCDYATSSGNIKIVDPLCADKAIKTLVNKVSQVKSTGAMTVYDNDGSTVLRTLTPTESSTEITITPS